MTKLLRILLASALALLPLSEALAGSSTITTKDASGATKTFFVTTDGGGNFYAAGVICDQSAAAACASVGTAGSPSTNALTVQAVTIGSGTAANAARVELANNGTGVLATVGTVTTVSTVTNLAQMNGAALLMGNGVTGTGSQRVTIASDNTAFSVNVANANANGSATEANSSPVVGKLTPTSASASALTDVACGSAVDRCVLKASAGNFYGVYAECSVACWLMVFNATSAPSNGSTTAGKSSGNMVDCVSIPAADQRGISYTVFPVAMSVGITAAISSTPCATLTLATTGFIHGTVQ